MILGIGLLVVTAVVVLLIIGSIVTPVCEPDPEPARTMSQKQVVRSASRTRAAIEHDYRHARQAMNDAAGQSWRNEFDA